MDTEQVELRRGLRSYLAKHSDADRVRQVMATESGMDDPLWHGMARDLGCHGLTVPGVWGGSGVTHVAQGVVFEELGRSLACVPYFATVGLALNLLMTFEGDAFVADSATRIAQGDLVATVALCEPGGGWDPAAVRMQATIRDGYCTVTGTKTYVPDGHQADVLLVVARTPGGLGIFVVESEATGVTRTQLATMDQTRRQARVEFNAAPARQLGDGSDATQRLARALAQAAALLAIEQVGTATQVLEATVEYTKMRTQFGAPIGSFQAVKHRLADMLLDVEAARSAAYFALFSTDAGDDEPFGSVSLAKAFCSDALVRVTEASIQLHGGIGLTWEHWAHLYFKRARSSAVLLGSAAEHRERLAQAIGV